MFIANPTFRFIAALIETLQILSFLPDIGACCGKVYIQWVKLHPSSLQHSKTTRVATVKLYVLQSPPLAPLDKIIGFVM